MKKLLEHLGIGFLSAILLVCAIRILSGENIEVGFETFTNTVFGITFVASVATTIHKYLSKKEPA